jgi:hypothetical protein
MVNSIDPTKTFKYEEGLLNKGFNKAKFLIEKQQFNDARDLIDKCIAIVGNERYYNNKEVEDKLENVRIKVWLERFWYLLENNNLLL